MSVVFVRRMTVFIYVTSGAIREAMSCGKQARTPRYTQSQVIPKRSANFAISSGSGIRRPDSYTDQVFGLQPSARLTSACVSPLASRAAASRRPICLRVS